MKKFIKTAILILALFASINFSACTTETKHEMGEWYIKTNATCITSEKLERVCSICGYTENKNGKEATGHTYTEETIEPTETTNGYTLHTCHCGHKYTNKITCLLSFESIADNNQITPQDLPQIKSIKVNQGTPFVGATNTNKLYVKEYRIYTNSNLYQTIVVDHKIMSSSKITIVWDLKDNQTAEQIEFNKIITKVKLLEDLSYAYNPDNNYQIRVMQFIRATRYNSLTWNSIGGAPDSNFVEYVKQNQGMNDLFALQNINAFTVPSTGLNVDFVHMIYTINAITLNGLNEYMAADLAGWGGDICQLVVESKNITYTSTTGLQHEIDSRFNSENSSFGAADVQADLASINIAKIYLTTAKGSISTALSQYFNLLTTEKQKEQFLANSGFGAYSNVDDMVTAMLSRLSGNVAINVWCAQPENQISFTKHKDYFLCACRALAKHLL